MSDPAKHSPPDSLQQQHRLVHSLRVAIYSQADPAAHPRFSELVQAEAELDLKSGQVPFADAVAQGD